jgi:hypothetical protein
MTERLTDEEQTSIALLGGGTAELVEALAKVEAQCRRDFALVAEWKARFEAADLERRAAVERTGAAERAEEGLRQRARTAESECAALRADLASAVQEQVDLKRERDESRAEAETAFANGAEVSAAECNTLRAEVERERSRRVEHRQMNQSLNEQVHQLSAAFDAAHDRELDAESHLAAATELLREVDDTLENDGPWLPLQYRIRALLAAQPAAPKCPANNAGVGWCSTPRCVVCPMNQPAAPEYRCGSCRDTGKWSNGIVCPVCQPAAPACGACPDIAECNNSGCRGCADGGPAAPAVRAPNPEAVARILADPDCAAPARRPDTRESSLFDSTGKPAAPTQKDTQ